MGHKVHGAKEHGKGRDNDDSSYDDIESKNSDTGGTETSGYDTDKHGKHSKGDKSGKGGKGHKKNKGGKSGKGDKANKRDKDGRAEINDVFQQSSGSQVPKTSHLYTPRCPDFSKDQKRLEESSSTPPPSSPASKAADDYYDERYKDDPNADLWKGNGSMMSNKVGYSPLPDEEIKNIINGTESFADRGFPSTAAVNSYSYQLINGLYKKIKSGDLTVAEALDKYKKEIEQFRKKNGSPVAGWETTIEALKEADGVLPSTSVDANTETSFTLISHNDSYPEATGDLRAAFLSTLPKNTSGISGWVQVTVGIQDNTTGEKFKVTYGR